MWSLMYIIIKIILWNSTDRLFKFAFYRKVIEGIFLTNFYTLIIWIYRVYVCI